jgi:hypothetical protein
MAEFIVVDVDAERRRVALMDRAGRYHIVSATAAMPPVCAYVRGFNPERGFGLLVEVQTGQVHRIVFEAVDCSQEKARVLLHQMPSAAPAQRASVAESPATPFRASRSPEPWDQLAAEQRAERSR